MAPHGSRCFYGAQHDLVVLVADLIDRVIATNLARPNNGMVTTSGVYLSTTITAVLMPLGPKHSIHVFANDGKWPIFPIYCRVPPNEVRASTEAAESLQIAQARGAGRATQEQTEPSHAPVDQAQA